MVRGEVIVDFSEDILVQGPIEVVFEGIQHYHTWQVKKSDAMQT